MDIVGKDRLPQDALCVHKYEDAIEIQRILIENGNAVLLTREDNLWCINWIWCESGYSNRNNVIFVDKSTVEYAIYNQECIAGEDEKEVF